MAVEIRSGRGIYAISLLSAPERVDGKIRLTAAFERADGVERFGLRFVFAEAVVAGASYLDDTASLIERIRPQIEANFEQIREAALKSIRTDKRLHEIPIDSE
jgi:hypothetical protein